jgi:hypothetical protein
MTRPATMLSTGAGPTRPRGRGEIGPDMLREMSGTTARYLASRLFPSGQPEAPQSSQTVRQESMAARSRPVVLVPQDQYCHRPITLELCRLQPRAQVLWGPCHGDDHLKIDRQIQRVDE